MNNKKILELKELLKEKQKKTDLTELDKEKIRNLEYIFKDNQVFFKIDFETAVGILQFLGINEDEILNYYNELISPENFKKRENTYITISKIK